MPLTVRQEQVYRFLIRHLDRHGYAPTLQEIAAHLGISGNLGVLRHLKALERNGLIRRTGGSSRAIVLTDSAANDGTLPLLGTVRAGAPQPAAEEIEGRFAVDEALVRSRDSFLLRVRGDSMIDAHIVEGDLVVVRPQASAENGEIVVALIDGDATLKRFYREGEEIRLKAENPTMKALIYRAGDAEVQIVGKVTGLCRPLG
jgi:repressor LexA